MDSQIQLHSSITCIVTLGEGLHRLVIDRQLPGTPIIKAGRSYAEIHLDAGFQYGPGVGGGTEIHIGSGNDTKAEHLGGGQHGAVVDGLIVQFGLKGENLLVQPVGKGHVLRIAPHEGHGGMAVCVDEAGHQQLAGAVIDLAEVFLGCGGADVGDLLIFDPHIITTVVVEIFVQNVDVGK